MSWKRFVDEEDRALIEGLIAQAIEDGKDYTYEHRIRTADGRGIWLRVNASVVLDDAESLRSSGASRSTSPR